MKTFYWKFRYAYWMHRRVGLSFDFCWDAATAAMDAYMDGMTPRDAVDTELSYWADD
jgi:hypothetical protein